MRITDVRVRRITQSGKMKAVVSITLDNEFVVHDIKVIDGEKGLFIAMPSRKAARLELPGFSGGGGVSNVVGPITTANSEPTIRPRITETVAGR